MGAFFFLGVDMRYTVFLLLVLFIFSSCSKKPEVYVHDLKTSISTDYLPEKYMFVRELNTKDRVVFFYQDHEGYTHYYNGKKDTIINREVVDKYKKKGGVPMSFSYAYDGKYLYFSQPIRWGPKKLIFIKMEPDGKVLYVKELSSLEQSIRPASVAFDGKGNMLLTWLDETPPYIKGAYMLVKGDSFPQKEEVIAFEDAPVLSIKPVYTSKGFAILYTKVGKGGDYGELRLRFLSDGSEKTLYAGYGVADFDISQAGGKFLIRPYEISEKVHLLIFDGNMEKVREYAINKPKDISNTFSPYDNPTLIDGQPFVLAGGIPPNSVSVDGYSLPQRQNVFYSYAGKDFERLVGGKLFMFTSEMPSVDSSKNYILVAYVDRRLASPTIMVSLLDKKGKVIKRDIIIEKPWVSTGSPRVVHLGEDLFRVFYPVEDKKEKVWIYRAKDIKVENLQNLYDIPPVKDREKRLAERVKQYVECRKNNDYKCVYRMLDPVYRSGISEAMHEEMMKRVNAKITEFRFDRCKILENSVIAACDGIIKAKLPEQIMNRPIKEQERNIEQKLKGIIWVYVDGDWYYAVDLPMLGYAIRW